MHAGRKVKIRRRVRDARARWLKLAEQTAQTNLSAHLAGRQTIVDRLQALQDAGLERVPVDSAEPGKWRDRLQTSNKELATSGKVSQQAMDEMLSHLAAYRAGQGQ